MKFEQTEVVLLITVVAAATAGYDGGGGGWMKGKRERDGSEKRQGFYKNKKNEITSLPSCARHMF
ncbi:hypothetical protein HanIR_Chr02g0088641 [Helianthus annuus]|nr:hypothetical protein HanIR_Chr02g0088641 [Helianthus annuus]